MSKSIKMIFKNTDYDSLFTYADTRQGHTGNTYLANNWIMLNDSKSDGYIWMLDDKIVNRRTFYNLFGTQSYDIVKKYYKHRLYSIKDTHPKKRLFYLKHIKQKQEFINACKFESDRIKDENIRIDNLVDKFFDTESTPQ